MRLLPLASALVLMLSGSLAAQSSPALQIEVEYLKQIGKTGEVQVYAGGSVVLVDNDSPTPTRPVAVASVAAPEASRVAVKVSNARREPVEFTKIDVRKADGLTVTKYLLSTPGKQWLEAIDLEDADWQTVLIEIGTTPDPGPDPEPPPQPGDLADKVAQWAAGGSVNQQMAEVYRRVATEYAESRSMSSQAAIQKINDGILNIPGYRKAEYEILRTNLNAETVKRWPMDRATLAQFWQTVAVGLNR